RLKTNVPQVNWDWVEAGSRIQVRFLPAGLQLVERIVDEEDGPDRAKPRQGRSEAHVVNRLNELRSGQDGTVRFDGFAPVNMNKLPEWVRSVLEYYLRINDQVRYERLWQMILGGRLLVGFDEKQVFYGARHLDPFHPEHILIATNNNKHLAETLIHEINGESHEENIKAERR